MNNTKPETTVSNTKPDVASPTVSETNSPKPTSLHDGDKKLAGEAVKASPTDTASKR